MSTTASNTGSADEQEALFTEVTTALREWVNHSDEYSSYYIENELRDVISGHLRRSAARKFADSTNVPKHTGGCDLVVNEQVGIKILYELLPGSNETLHKQIRSIFQEYDYVIVYAHQIHAEHTDRWRQIERSVSRYTKSGNKVYTLSTIKDDRTIEQVTKRRIVTGVIKKWGAFSAFLAFVSGGAYFLEASMAGTDMGLAYVGAVIVFNVVVVLMAILILKS